MTFKNCVILIKLQLRLFNLEASFMLLMPVIVVGLKSHIQLPKFSIEFARLFKRMTLLSKCLMSTAVYMWYVISECLSVATIFYWNILILAYLDEIWSSSPSAPQVSDIILGKPESWEVEYDLARKGCHIFLFSFSMRFIFIVWIVICSILYLL